MSENAGTLERSELAKLVRDGLIHTVIVGSTDCYGRYVGKRFDAEYFLDQVATAGTHACDYLLTVDMEMEPIPGYEFANWERGYGDFHLVPDWKTCRIAGWLEGTAVMHCAVQDDQHQDIPVAPRSILRAQLTRAAKIGLEALGASELEYYIFRNGYQEAAAQGYKDLTPAGWYIEDYHILQARRVEDINGAARRALRASGIVPECTKGEWGLGQHELNIRYCEVLDMADRHVLVKQCLKEIADQQHASVTFMAKFAADGAGSSCHIHLSLWQDGQNAFVGDTSYGPVQGSEIFGHVAAGWIQFIPELMVLLAPNVNSYKRYQSGSWAPTRLAWSYDNRTAAVRVVGAGPALRLECRVPGADCNPYLAYAALLAAGMEGIRQKLVPPPLYAGDVYATKDVPQLPQTLSEAILHFESSEIACRAFGQDVMQHYVHFFRTEQATYERTVTDWERQRYFERI